VATPLAVLAVTEAAGPSTAVRTLARCALALSAFVAMAWWVRVNRAALDLEQWCDCAGRTITVRAIESHRPAALPLLEPAAPVTATADDLVPV
jgi:hypothetical protein